MTDPRWDEIIRARGWGRWPNTRFVEWCMRRYGRGDWADRTLTNFLELGCGGGAQLRFLADEGFNAYGIDSSPAAIAATLELVHGGRVAIMEADLLSSLYEEFLREAGSFDCIFDICTLQHMDLDQATFMVAKARKWLMPGGAFFSLHAAAGSSAAGYGDVPEPRLLRQSEIPAMFDGFDVSIGHEVVTGIGAWERRHWIIEGIKNG